MRLCHPAVASTRGGHGVHDSSVLHPSFGARGGSGLILSVARTATVMPGPWPDTAMPYTLRLVLAVAGALHGSSGHGCFGYLPRISARTWA